MCSLAFLNRGRCLHFFLLSFWQSRFIPQHARRLYNTHWSGKIWYLLAYTQLYHSPTSVQGNAGSRGWSAEASCTSAPGLERGLGLADLLEWTQIPVQVPAMFTDARSPEWD